MRADRVMLRLRSADPARRLEPTSAAAREQLRQSITAAPTSSPPPLERLSRRRRPILVLAAGLLAAVATAGAGAWVLGGRATDTTSLTCALEADSASMIDSASGDPIADCQAEWQRLFHSAPPALVAYDTGGDVTVVPAGSAVPAEWKALPADFHQDARLIELDERLGDSAAGLFSDCFSLEQARTLAQRLVRRSGLDGWSVVYESDAQERAGSCTAYWLDRASKHVVLISRALTFQDANAPHLVLARRLGEAAARACLTISEAAARVRREAAKFGWQESDSSLVINSHTTEGCADIVVNVGGRVEVTIRGKRS
jgi:hypothetical protein